VGVVWGWGGGCGLVVWGHRLGGGGVGGRGIRVTKSLTRQPSEGAQKKKTCFKKTFEGEGGASHQARLTGNELPRRHHLGRGEGIERASSEKSPQRSEGKEHSSYWREK